MATLSQQVLYADLFKDKVDRLTNIDDYAWGEELFEFPIIVFTKGGKTIPKYKSIYQSGVRVGLITINPLVAGMIEVVPALYEPSSKRIFIKDTQFNKYWIYLRESIKIGIDNNYNYCVEKGIKNPEDIVDLRALWDSCQEPFIKDGTIQYKVRKQEKNSREQRKRNRQSKIDDPNNIYFYSSNENGSRRIHDKECKELNYITDGSFTGSPDVPDGYILCPKCKRQLMIRIGCHPNTKQIPVCSRFFQEHRVSTAAIQKMIDRGITFHATNMSIMTINGIEDTWQIRAAGEGVSLWHNNYVRVSDTERYITDGFHKQNCKGNMSYMLNYIEGYTWKKHLEGEARKQSVIKEKPSVIVNEVEITKRWYSKLFDLLKKVLKVR